MFEVQVAMLRRKIVDLIRFENYDSGIAIAAMAEIMGLYAAIVDRREGGKSLNDLIGHVEKHMRQAYKRERDVAETAHGAILLATRELNALS